MNVGLDDYEFATVDGSVTVIERLPGDVNDDGEVNLKDTIMLERFLATGWDVQINESNADVNADGAVNLKDSVLLKRHFATGWDVELK